MVLFEPPPPARAVLHTGDFRYRCAEAFEDLRLFPSAAAGHERELNSRMPPRARASVSPRSSQARCHGEVRVPPTGGGGAGRRDPRRSRHDVLQPRALLPVAGAQLGSRRSIVCFGGSSALRASAPLRWGYETPEKTGTGSSFLLFPFPFRTTLSVSLRTRSAPSPRPRARAPCSCSEPTPSGRNGCSSRRVPAPTHPYPPAIIPQVDACLLAGRLCRPGGLCLPEHSAAERARAHSPSPPLIPAGCARCRGEGVRGSGEAKRPRLPRPLARGPSPGHRLGRGDELPRGADGVRHLQAHAAHRGALQGAVRHSGRVRAERIQGGACQVSEARDGGPRAEAAAGVLRRVQRALLGAQQARARAHRSHRCSSCATFYCRSNRLGCGKSDGRVSLLSPHAVSMS